MNKHYDFLVVCCPPSAFASLTQLTETEAAVFGKLKHLTMHTTLISVAPNELTKSWGVVMDPMTGDEMKGRIRAFRNETAKTYGLVKASQMKENLVVVYQQSAAPLTGQQFNDIMAKQ